MIRCVIVDDEAKSRESLSILLNDFVDDVEVAALCENVSQGVEAIKRYKPDVVFLDIQMQRETGFDLLNQYNPIPFHVIFTTAHAEYALKAFKFSALDYLLKPIDLEELRNAVKKIESKKSGKNTLEALQLLMQCMKSPSENFSKLALPSNDGLEFINVQDIVYCEAAGNYTTFVMIDGRKFVVSRTLKEYDELLTDQGFFRIHNSFLINLKALKKYVRGEGGYVIMNNDVSLDVSKRRKDKFLSRIGSKG